MSSILFETIVAGLILVGCQTKSNTGRSIPATDTVKLGDRDTTTNVKTDTSNLATDNSGCTRGQAKSVARKTIYPKALFKLNEDNHTRTETLELKDGDKLIIKNWGCEYYVLTFRFETNRFHADTTDIKYWMDKAVILMTEIEKGLDAPFSMESGTLATKEFLKSNKEYKLDEEIVFNQSEIRSFVTFDRIQRIDDKKFAIEISYATGPL